MSAIGAFQQSRLAVLMFTDVVGSTQLKSRLGVETYLRLLGRHDQLFREALADAPGAEILQDTGDGYFVAFANVTDAVRCALRLQHALRHEPAEGAPPLRIRIGIHLGQLAVIEGSARPKVIGMAADMASRLTSLAQPGQILLSRAVFDESRQFLRDHPATSGNNHGLRLKWVAHGDYLFKGADEPMEVFEVGVEGAAPLSPPADNDKAHRSVSLEQTETLGWRPAVGLEVPQRPAWLLERKLGEGTFGEVWLASHRKLKQQRVFKFCFDADRLHSFKRELTFFRLIRDALGQRRDIAQLYDVRLDAPPFFLESEFAPGGNLIDWAAAQGGLDRIPLAARLEIVAKVCDAVAAAHSLGILHKDIKPGNVLMHVGRDGSPQPQLADFGIGLLADRTQLAARNITESGFTMLSNDRHSSRTGTQMYIPPESLAGRPFTTQGDIYALGVLLYQMTIADLDRPLAEGWERSIDDPVLREDIAACIEGDPQRRINSAAEIATRLRALPQRRQQYADQQRRREHARRRRRLLRITSVAVVFFAALSSLAIVGFVRERGLRRSSQVSERKAQLERATGVLENATALALLGRGQPSREAFAQARDQLAQLGESTLPAEVGLYRTYRDFESPINTITGHTDAVMSVAWLPDGVRACSAGLDGTIRLWDARTGRQLGNFDGHAGAVLSIAVSADGQFLLSGGKDQTIRLWNVQTHELLHQFSEPIDEVRGVAFSPDGRFALSGCEKHPDKPAGAVRIWDLQSRSLARTFAVKGNEGFYGVAFSPDGRYCLATTYQYGIWIWDARTGEAVRRLPPPQRREGAGHSGYVSSAVFLAGSNRILSASADKSLRLWDVNSGEQIKPLYGHTAGVRSVALADKSETTALSSGMDGLLRLWDLNDGRITRSFAGHIGGVPAVAVSPDGSRAISGGFDKTVRIWNLTPTRDEPTTRESAPVTALASSPDGALLICGDYLGGVSLRDAATLKLLRTFVDADRLIGSVAITGGEQAQMISATDAGAVTVRDVSTGRLLGSFPARRPPGTGRIGGPDWSHTAVAADGRFAVSSTEHRRHLDFWSLENGKIVGSVGPASGDITCVAIAPDASHALAGDVNGTVHYWNLATGERIFSEPVGPKPGRVDCVAISPDGKRALSGGHDSLVHLWDLAQRRQLQSFVGHSHNVSGVGFGHEGRTVFSISFDKTARLWDVATGDELEVGTLFPWPAYALSLIWADGDVAVCGAGSRITLLDLSRTERYLDFQRRLDPAHDALRSNKDDPAALAALGEWYAFRGADDWAIDCLSRARAGGAPISSLTLARSYWQLDRRAEAVREFQDAIARDPKLEPYLRLCIRAVVDRPTTRPIHTPTTSPAVRNASEVSLIRHRADH